MNLWEECIWQVQLQFLALEVTEAKQSSKGTKDVIQMKQHCSFKTLCYDSVIKCGCGPFWALLCFLFFLFLFLDEAAKGKDKQYNFQYKFLIHYSWSSLLWQIVQSSSL